MPVFEREYAKKGMGFGTYWFLTPVPMISKVPIDDLSDLGGLKVRCWNDSTARIITGMGGVPVIMSSDEIYVAMQRGVVDAAIGGASAFINVSLHEQAKYLYLINLAPGFSTVTYNVKAFDALDAEYQKALTDEWANLRQEFIEAQPIADKATIDTLAKNGVEIIEPDPAQMAKVVEQLKPIWNDWGSESDINKEVLDAALKAFGLS